MLFACIDNRYEVAFAQAVQSLSKRYNMDFTRPTQQYTVLGRPQNVAEGIYTFYAVGVRPLRADIGE